MKKTYYNTKLRTSKKSKEKAFRKLKKLKKKYNSFKGLFIYRSK